MHSFKRLPPPQTEIFKYISKMGRPGEGIHEQDAK
jgi:hypothetical protein